MKTVELEKNFALWFWTRFGAVQNTWLEKNSYENSRNMNQSTYSFFFVFKKFGIFHVIRNYKSKCLNKIKLKP